MSLRLAFMGTPDFSVPILAALIDAGHEIAAVYSQPPRRAGRGHKEQPSPVHAFALSRDLPVRTPLTLRDPGEQAAFAALALDVAVVAAYGLILPQPILDAPKQGCVNVHASLLPRWRGAAPIQRAILAGDAVTGVSIMQMDKGLDTGPVLAMREQAIDSATTGESLHDALAALGATMIVESLADIEAGRSAARPQPGDGVTYAAKLSKDEGRLDWTLPAAELERAVRAYYRWPAAWFEHGGERFKVLAASAGEKGNDRAPPGTLLDDRLLIACGQGTALRLVRVQRAGKGPLDTESFLRGFPLTQGTKLCPATN